MIKAKNILFFDFDATEVARQMTLIESRYFLRIKPHELIKQEWAAKKVNSKAVNVRAMSSLSTNVSRHSFIHMKRSVDGLLKTFCQKKT
jgi:hypothetical protein